jgi:hypothetical protein
MLPVLWQSARIISIRKRRNSMAMRGTSQGMPNIFYKGVEIPAESIEVSSSIGGYLGTI